MRRLSPISNNSEWCAAADSPFPATHTDKFRSGKILAEMIQGVLVGST
jgi:hypothetical protein